MFSAKLPADPGKAWEEAVDRLARRRKAFITLERRCEFTLQKGKEERKESEKGKRFVNGKFQREQMSKRISASPERRRAGVRISGSKHRDQ